MMCLKSLLHVSNIAEQKQACGQRESCRDDLKEKVYALIKFRFYDLEERVEELYEDGTITKSQATEMIATLEEQKIKFNAATSKQQRRDIILETKSSWQEFAHSIPVR
ncbi:hypothetical protein HYU22_00160 [Candidatus Woesearchaeota archaeon]|nr:hypothetical protein [Candidatus Woesearchaeota archaeon]